MSKIGNVVEGLDNLLDSLEYDYVIMVVDRETGKAVKKYRTTKRNEDNIVEIYDNIKMEK